MENSDECLKVILEGLLNGKIDVLELRKNAFERSNYFSQFNIKEFEDVVNEI